MNVWMQNEIQNVISSGKDMLCSVERLWNNMLESHQESK